MHHSSTVPDPVGAPLRRRTVLGAGVAGVMGLAAVAAADPAEAASRRRRRRRRAAVATTAVTAAATTAETTAATTLSGLPFLLGAAGDGIADGSYERALGRPLDLTATWADSDWASTNLPVLAPGGALAGWSRALDVCVGAFSGGKSWAQAAAGDFDARWTASLQRLAALRAGAPGPTFVRFAHEMNGSWYPWSVTAASLEDFKVAWRRYRALQQRHFPAARLVLSLNHNTAGFDADSAALHPGAGQLDVLGASYYNRYPYLRTAADFSGWLPARDRWGGAAGLDAFRGLAAGWGVPLCLPEWSACAEDSGGDAPEFVSSLHQWLTTHAGTGAGQVLYACQFNVSSGHDGAFTLLPPGRLPLSSAEYLRCFGR